MNITSAKYLKKMAGDKDYSTIVAVWDGVTHFVPINEEGSVDKVIFNSALSILEKLQVPEG